MKKDMVGWMSTSEPTEIVVFLTNECNMNCSYCYVKKDRIKQPNFEMQKRTIEQILRTDNGKIKKITFTGGEPLLYFDYVKKIIEVSREIRRGIDFQINTNCTLINKNNSKFINSQRIKISASIDGMREIHDSTRKFTSGLGTFDKVMDNIRFIDPLLINIHMVLTPGYTRIFNSVTELYKEGMRNFYIDFNLLAEWDPLSLKKIKEELLMFRKRFIREYDSIGGARLLNLEKILLGLNNHNKNKCDYITIDTEGNINSCHMHPISIKKMSDNNNYNVINARRSLLLDRIKNDILKKSKQCKECSISFLCFCPVDAYHSNTAPNFKKIQRLMCFFSHELAKNMIIIKDFLEYSKKASMNSLYGIKSVSENDKFSLVTQQKINQIWFSLTNKCTFNCNYCFVPKGNESMDIAIINNALDILFSSQGIRKKLIFFGGEPLTDFGLVKDAIQLAKIKSAFSGKTIEFGIGTNGSVIDNKIVDYVMKNDVQVSISMDGKKEAHNKRRRFNDGSFSFDAVEKNLNIFTERLPEKNISCLFGVHHTEVKNIHENFMFLVEKEKFRTINIEPIQTGHAWTPDEISDFAKELIKVFNYIENGIINGNFIFINKMNRMIKDNLRGSSQLLDTLTFFPDGNITMNVFLYYLNKKYIIGNVFEGITNLHEHSSGNDVPPSKVDCNIIKKRNGYINKFAAYILRKSKIDRNYMAYVKEAKRRVFE